MSLSQTIVTGSLKTAKGLPAPVTQVTFRLKGSDYEDGELIVIKDVHAEVVDTKKGTFRATLWPNDRGTRGNTNYSVNFKFSDGSSVAGMGDLYVRYSDIPVTLEDIEVQDRIADAVQPLGLVTIRRSEFDPEQPMEPNAVSRILEG